MQPKKNNPRSWRYAVAGVFLLTSEWKALALFVRGIRCVYVVAVDGSELPAGPRGMPVSGLDVCQVLCRRRTSGPLGLRLGQLAIGLPSWKCVEHDFIDRRLVQVDGDEKSGLGVVGAPTAADVDMADRHVPCRITPGRIDGEVVHQANLAFTLADHH